MEILDILKNKRNEIMRSDYSLDIVFQYHEIEVVNDLTNLRVLKLIEKFPKEYKSCKDLISCYEKVKQNGSIYDVLEYFFLCNTVLRESILKVFPRIIQ